MDRSLLHIIIALISKIHHSYNLKHVAVTSLIEFSVDTRV